MILAIRTDSPIAELYLFDTTARHKDRDVWKAGNKLSVQILEHIQKLLKRHKHEFKSLTGIIVFAGPGSFTGLRIGITVANTLAWDQNIPIVGAQGDEWLVRGQKQLQSAKPGRQVTPHYGAEPNISKPRK